MIRRTFFASCLALGGSLALTACSFPDEVASASSAAASQNAGAVSAADPRAEEAGYEILRQGGNATDAALAVMLALTVVEPQSSGIGGGGFYVHANPDGAVTSLDGRETAPIAAGPDWFLDEEGAVKPFRDVVSTGLSIGVPGNIALAAKAHERHGKLSWKALFQPAIRLARDGFRVTPRLHNSLGRERSRSKNDPASLALYYTAEGEPVAIGSTITVPELADTLEAIASKGPKAFYEGETATAMAATSEAVIFGLAQGLEFDSMIDVLNVSTGMNTATKDKFPNRIGTGTYDAGFRSALMRKDMRLYREGVASAGTPATISATVDDIWDQVDRERPGSDLTEVFKFLRGEES